MKPRVFCSLRVGVGMEATGMSWCVEATSALPAPLLSDLWEFLISQALGCLHTSQPQASQEAILVGGRGQGRDVLSCPGHSLAFATLCFLQPPSPSSWGPRAGSQTHNRSQPGLWDSPWPELGGVAGDSSWRVPSLLHPAPVPGLPYSGGADGWTGQLGGCPEGAIQGSSSSGTGVF